MGVALSLVSVSGRGGIMLMLVLLSDGCVAVMDALLLAVVAFGAGSVI